MTFHDQDESDAVQYWLSVDGPSYPLSEHFRLIEVASKDGADGVLVHPALIALCEEFRSEIGPFSPKSAYRTYEHQRSVYRHLNAIREAHGLPPVRVPVHSYHPLGMAVDIHRTQDHAPRELKGIAQDLGVGGIGLYSWGIHADVGPKRTW